MSNRRVALIVKEQDPLIATVTDTVQHACQLMWNRRGGVVLVVSTDRQLAGIFTGRDAVRTLAQGCDPGATSLARVMTPNPDTIGPEHAAIDALRMMSDGGYCHLPIVADGVIEGIVSRTDFKGPELARLEYETHLWECIA